MGIRLEGFDGLYYLKKSMYSYLAVNTAIGILAAWFQFVFVVNFSLTMLSQLHVTALFIYEPRQPTK